MKCFGGGVIKNFLAGALSVVLLAVISYVLFDKFFSKLQPPPPPPNGITELSLNGVDVGIPLSRLNEILGDADSIEGFGDYEIRRYGALKAEIRNEKVYALMTDDKSFKTSKKIHVGSTYSDVISAYGQNASKSSEKFTIYEYSRDALAGETGVLRFSVDGEHLSAPVVYISVRLVVRREAKDNVEQAKVALYKTFEAIARGNYDKVYDEMLTDNYKNQVSRQQFVGLCKQITSVDYNDGFTEVSSNQNSVVLAFEIGSRTKTKTEQKLHTSWKGEVEMVNEAGVWKINVIVQSRGSGTIEK